MESNFMRTFLSLALVALVLWFAAENATTVALDLFLWDINVSLALIVGVAFLLGFLLGVLRLAPGFWRGHFAARESKRALDVTKKERDALAERSQVLEEQVQQLAPRVSPENKNDAL
jgi:lipopolysaccharide assembly protein A